MVEWNKSKNRLCYPKVAGFPHFLPHENATWTESMWMTYRTDVMCIPVFGPNRILIANPPSMKSSVFQFLTRCNAYIMSANCSRHSKQWSIPIPSLYIWPRSIACIRNKTELSVAMNWFLFELSNNPKIKQANKKSISRRSIQLYTLMRFTLPQCSMGIGDISYSIRGQS